LNKTGNKWIAEEFKTLEFGSARLEKRFVKTMSDMSEQPDKSIFLTSGSRSQAQAVYRMIANEKCTKEEIISSHRDAMGVRSSEETVLLAVQDTMSVNYAGHEKTEGMGYNCEKSLGVNTHTCLSLTLEGIPLGLLTQSQSTRTEKDERSASEKQRRPIEEKESYRWLETMEEAAANAPENVKLIHICDREGDIYELYAQAERTGEAFIIRAAHDRMNTENERIIESLYDTEIAGREAVTIPANHAARTKERDVVMKIRYKEFEVKKPVLLNSDKSLEPSLKLTLISLLEENPPMGMFPIEWLLMTNLPVYCAEDAVQIAKYYKQRWKIERFHFVLKSGCKIEKLQQRSVDGIELLILMYSIIAVHIMALTYIARNAPETPCDLIFAEIEWQTLFRAANSTTAAPKVSYSMADAVRYVAKLGGFVGAPSDGPPGLKVIWIGLNKLFILVAYRDFI
jgi:hypothetical protein